ncbi:MAG: AAA family ATPase [Phycisphaerae bacterium]|nr:AAA family ATPase [Phycisphaerae bacterium]
MAKNKAGTEELKQLIMEAGVPDEHKAVLIHQIITHDPEQGLSVIRMLIELGTAAKANEQAKKLAAQYRERLEEMQRGSTRSGVFLQHAEEKGGMRRAHVRLQDGMAITLPVPDEKLAEALRRGDSVEIDREGKAIIGSQPCGDRSGEIAILGKRVGDYVDVTLREQEGQHFLASQRLTDQIEAGEVEPGAKIVVSARQEMAFYALPGAGSKFEHYKFLSKEPVPTVTVDDLGDPPSYILEILEDVELTLSDRHEWLRKRWNAPLLTTLLLQGGTGTGKTYSLMALHRAIYDRIASISGVPSEELPPRCFRLNAASTLSHLLGVSDKNIDRLFSEAEQMAGEPVELNGKFYHLPCIVILEEIDALARRRSVNDADNEAVYSRLCSGLLAKVDPTRKDLADKHLIVIATTNLVEALDSAFTRRFQVTRFGHLDRHHFRSVIAKHLGRLPVALQGEPGEKAARQRLVSEAEAFLFAPNGDPGQLQVYLVGSSTPMIIYRRQMLTPAIVAKAVEQAARRVRRQEAKTGREVGITTRVLLGALDRQIRDVAEMCNRGNITGYVDVGAGQISDVRLIEQSPIVSSHELLRAAS